MFWYLIFIYRYPRLRSLFCYLWDSTTISHTRRWKVNIQPQTKYLFIFTNITKINCSIMYSPIPREKKKNNREDSCRKNKYIWVGTSTNSLKNEQTWRKNAAKIYSIWLVFSSLFFISLFFLKKWPVSQYK